MNTTQPRLAVTEQRADKDEAKALAAWIEGRLSPDDEPVDYVEAFLIGVWRRITDRRRLIAPVIWETCVMLAQEDAPMTAVDPFNVQWLDRNPMALTRELIATRAAVASGAYEYDDDDREEALTVLDGLVGAVSAGRAAVAGDLVVFLRELGLAHLLCAEARAQGLRC